MKDREAEEFALTHRLTKQREEEELRRIEFERRRAESEERKKRVDEPDLKTALAALTTITVLGSEPISSTKQYSTSVTPVRMDEAITTTTTTTTVETQRVREEIVKKSEDMEVDRQLRETEYISSSSIFSDDKPKEPALDLEKARREFAGNYSNSLVFNAFNRLITDESRIVKPTPITTTPLTLNKIQIADELTYLLDERSPALNSSFTDLDESKFVRKTYVINKMTEPSFISARDNGQLFSPFPLGFKIRKKEDLRDTGDHVISYVEPSSPAERVGIKPNSRLVKINEITCDDKTQDFVLFLLNFLLRKANATSIELTVDEPLFSPMPSIYQPRLPVTQTTTTTTQLELPNFTAKNDYLKWIIKSASDGKPLLANATNRAYEEVESVSHLKNIYQDVVKTSNSYDVNMSGFKPIEPRPFLPDQGEGPAKYIDAKPGTQYLCMIILEAIKFNKNMLFHQIPGIDEKIAVTRPAQVEETTNVIADPSSIQAALAVATKMATLDQHDVNDSYQSLPAIDQSQSSLGNLKSIFNEALNTHDNYDKEKLKRHQGITRKLAKISLSFI